jgi:hypothetical protein
MCTATCWQHENQDSRLKTQDSRLKTREEWHLSCLNCGVYLNSSMMNGEQFKLHSCQGRQHIRKHVNSIMYSIMYVVIHLVVPLHVL